MAQLVAEEMLIVLHVSLKLECAERSAALHQQVADPSSNQESNEMVV